MDINDLVYPVLLKLFPQHLVPGRSESAALLIWYLENYYRLDEDEAVDAVCDKRGDKGIDGIFVNDDQKTITVFQATISQSADRTIGDASLREFAGTLTQFKDAKSIENCIASAGTGRVATLMKDLDIANKIASHQLRGEFIANIELDANGAHFIEGSNITFIGPEYLVKYYISDKRNTPVGEAAQFDTTGIRISEYIVDGDTKAIIVPIKATELVNLQGISDQSLFTYNVRGPLGKTKVNRDIVASINKPDIHKLFPLFHNGITIIAKVLDELKDQIKINHYFVVNGCQSLTALYDNRTKVTDNLRILVKFIKADPSSQLAADITDYSNNQNAVKPRDFMANNSIQIRLQNEFSDLYNGSYFFEIKRGEIPPTSGQVISNEGAGLLLMAFDLKEPWGTHRKYQVFEEKHVDLFARPEVTADRIVLLQIISERVAQGLKKMNNKLFAKYSLTKYFLLYVIRSVLESDQLPNLLIKPQDFVRNADGRIKFAKLMDSLMDGIIIDLNAEVDDLGEDFDYRDKLRDPNWVNELRKKLVAEHLKDIKRGKLMSLKEQWYQLIGT